VRVTALRRPNKRPAENIRGLFRLALRVQAAEAAVLMRHIAIRVNLRELFNCADIGISVDWRALEFVHPKADGGEFTFHRFR
jgi:hypothetical protein